MTHLDGMNFADLPAALGDRLDTMPWVHRIIAENLLRHGRVDPDAASAFAAWQAGEAPEIPFYPSRLMMHDTTCGPALVDLAAMRDVIARSGGDPTAIRPVLRVDVSTDHSLAVDHHGAAGSRLANLAAEMRRNAERFGLMKWASATFDDLYVHPPGTGIMHTINLEQLATIVTTAHWQGADWAFPDTLLGTDSHTPMVNGIGVLAWGVGGLEAESVMLGMPVMLRIPDVIGVRLSGALQPGVLATDLALHITHMLRGVELDGAFVEFFGPGVCGLSAGTRSVVANMAPEFGGATGFFAPDAQVMAYLAETGRPVDRIAMVERYARHQRLWLDPAAEPDYARILNLDLSTVGPAMAGPHRPQDLLPRGIEMAGEERPIAIAAITSCTNTSDPRLLIAAGLLARAARERGLAVPGWVKTSLAPGSPSAATMLARVGLLADLEALGFAIVGYGCTTCIGNSGPLTPQMEAMIAEAAVDPVALLSGNRNFPGRVHRQITDSYLASPPLVVAHALAGHFGRDIERDAIGTGSDGRSVRLADIWPDDAAIDVVLAAALRPEDFALAYAEAKASDAWQSLPAPETPLYAWTEGSTYLRPPPFVSAKRTSLLGRYAASPLMVLGDDVTTDHISPAGAIPVDSDAARWLIARAEDPADLNVFSARRGNWEVMLRGLFTNPAVRNLLAPGLKPGTTVHGPSGEAMPLWAAAERYRSEDRAVVMVAGARYGMGSSRDWAAKGQYLLGVRAVLASGFERIHRSNLINMGIVPLELPKDLAPGMLGLSAGDMIHIDLPDEALLQRGGCPVRIVGAGGPDRQFDARIAVETQAEVEVLRRGGMIPLILDRAARKAS